MCSIRLASFPCSVPCSSRGPQDWPLPWDQQFICVPVKDHSELPFRLQMLNGAIHINVMAAPQPAQTDLAQPLHRTGRDDGIAVTHRKAGVLFSSLQVCGWLWAVKGFEWSLCANKRNWLIFFKLWYLEVKSLLLTILCYAWCNCLILSLLVLYVSWHHEELNEFI